MKKSLFIFLLLSSCDGLEEMYNSFFSEKENDNKTYEILKNDNEEKINNANKIINDPIIKEFSEIDNSHNLSTKYIKNLLQKGDSIKILDTKYEIKSNSIVRVTTEYKWTNSLKKSTRMRLIADFNRKKNKIVKIIFHNQI